MKLNELKPAKGAVKKRKRIGRGVGSGRGKTATRGHNGAKSRSGYKVNPGFEGGSLPIHRRVPKFGFKNFNHTSYHPVNIGRLQEIVDEKGITSFDEETFKNQGIAPKGCLVKVLGEGTLNASIEVKAHAFSKTAQKAIEDNGGKAIKLGRS